MSKYLFHYNGSEAIYHDSQKRWYQENLPTDDARYMLTEHEQLLRQDGNLCTVYMATKETWNGKEYVEAFFEDGNELTVCLDELIPA